MSDQWTIEQVEIRTPESRLREDPYNTLGIPPDVVRCVAFGRMNDGRPFVWEIWPTVDYVNAVGEERLREILKIDARPPRGEMSETKTVRLVGGPADGRTLELAEGIRSVRVPVLGRDIDRWVPRGKYPRRRPRGIWQIIYTPDARDPTVLRCDEGP